MDDDVAAVGDADRLGEILLGHQHGEPILFFQLLDLIDGAADQDRGEPDRGLVDQQDARRQHQRPPERQHLLLAAAQTPRELASPLRELRERLEAERAIVRDLRPRDAAEGVDPLGYYLGTWGFAYIQILGEAVTATKSLDDNKLADYIGKTTFKTIMGDVKFGKGGEWAQSRVLQVQFQHIKGNAVDQFRDISTQVVVAPDPYKSGSVIYPYEKAKE